MFRYQDNRRKPTQHLLPTEFKMVSRYILFLFGISLFISSCATTEKSNYIAEGNQYAKDGLWREASESYKKALVVNSNNYTASRNLGMVMVKIGDYKNAIKYLEKSLTRYESDYDANFYLGEAYRAIDNYAEAIFRYKRALQIKPNQVKAQKPLAWSYFKIRYYSEALIISKTLLKSSPNDDQIAIIVARTLLKLKRPKEALAIVKNAKQNVNRGSKPFFASVEGDIYYELKNNEQAIRSYKLALKDQPLLAGALLGLGKVMLEQGNQKQAISYMERAIRIRPRLTEGHYFLGRAYETTDPQKSLRYYQIFRKQASADPEFISLLGEVKNRISSLAMTGPSSEKKSSSQNSKK
jgi:tetratricopeptide (TPR) repeat protein